MSEEESAPVEVVGKEIDFHAHLGHPLPKGSSIATESMVVEALKTVQDPELMLDIYSLGLIYKINISEVGDVTIEMTLTSPMCPIAGEMPGMVALAVSKVEGVGSVDVSLVWDPPWTLDMLDEDLKLALGIEAPMPSE
ncbi:MAG: DUF59 domain-containing protein [Alphaproteobacteria bacterium]|nr:DUF59 domain-containing protein [Alphaproteobacteria bacterium]